MRILPFNFKIEEFIPFCDFSINSYTVDRPKFVIFSPEYDGDHLTDTINLRDTVDGLINPKAITVQMKNTTEKLYKLLDLGLTIIDDLERYCEKAGVKVPVSKKDFGFSTTRKKCHNRDAEGAISGFKLMKELSAPYLSVLTPLGYTVEKQTNLSNLIKDIGDTNTLQNSIYNQRGVLVQNNIGQITELWDTIKDILKTGKIIFKKDPVKIKEYTQAKILERIRQDRDNDNGGTPNA
jgi:hypothetical protein